MERKEFNDWPQINFKGLRILLANTEDLASQGFAGARGEEFENTIIIFPKVLIDKDKPFSNKAFNYGSVRQDIKIVYLNENYKKLGECIMVAETGTSSPPENAKIAIEGLP